MISFTKSHFLCVTYLLVSFSSFKIFYKLSNGIDRILGKQRNVCICEVQLWTMFSVHESNVNRDDER